METTRLWGLIQAWLDVQFFRPSQAQLADKLGVARNAVTKWKYGESRPTPQNLRSLSQVTGIPFNTLRIAVVEDLGYMDEEGQDDDEAPISQAAGSAAPEVTVADEEGVPLQSPRQRAAGDDSPPRRESPDRGRRG